jgi:hypothetical protein
MLSYVNADILLMPDFVVATRKITAQTRRFLVVGQRWDLEVTELLSFTPGWDFRLQTDTQNRGCLHAPLDDIPGPRKWLARRRCHTGFDDYSPKS